MIAIFGSTCSGAARTASRAMSKAGFSMVSGNNSAPFLTSIGGKAAPDWHPGYFRTSNNEENAGKAAAMFVFEKLKVQHVATINAGDIYTRGLTNGFIKEFKKLGGKIVLDTMVNKGEKEMSPVLTAVKNAGVRLLFFPLFQPEGNLIVKQAKQISGYDSIILMGDGALIGNSFITDVTSKAKGMYFVGPSSPKSSPAVNALDARYKVKYKETSSNNYYIPGYNAALMLLAAIEKAAVQEKDGTLHIGRDGLRKALYATKEFQGVTGPLTCDEFGDCARPAFDILRLDDPAAGAEALQKNIIFTYSPKE